MSARDRNTRFKDKRTTLVLSNGPTFTNTRGRRGHMPTTGGKSRGSDPPKESSSVGDVVAATGALGFGLGVGAWILDVGSDVTSTIFDTGSHVVRSVVQDVASSVVKGGVALVVDEGQALIKGIVKGIPGFFTKLLKPREPTSTIDSATSHGDNMGKARGRWGARGDGGLKDDIKKQVAALELKTYKEYVRDTPNRIASKTGYVKPDRSGWGSVADQRAKRSKDVSVSVAVAKAASPIAVSSRVTSASPVVSSVSLQRSSDNDRIWDLDELPQGEFRGRTPSGQVNRYSIVGAKKVKRLARGRQRQKKTVDGMQNRALGKLRRRIRRLER